MKELTIFLTYIATGPPNPSKQVKHACEITKQTTSRCFWKLATFASFQACTCISSKHVSDIANKYDRNEQDLGNKLKKPPAPCLTLSQAQSNRAK